MNEKNIALINDLCEMLNSEYAINEGGCCYVAYLIAKNLEQMHIAYNLVVYDYSFYGGKTFIKRNIKEHNTWFAKEGYCHYCIQLKDKTLLNEGGYDDCFDYKRLELPNIKADDILFLYRKGDWNKDYSKRHNITIKSKINKLFKTLNYEQE